MRTLIVFLFFLITATSVNGQDSLRVSLQSFWSSSDSLQVVLNLDQPGDSLSVPIWAFEFHVELPETLRFVGVTSTATLSSKEGWTIGKNVDRLWAGGFSSSTRAIHSPGSLVALWFVPIKDSNRGQICIPDLRLNSGNPASIPQKVCTDF